jgi:uncharacterized repeat protein (TIGR01451 family)
LTDQQANLNIRDLTLSPSAPDTIFAATAGGGILKTADGGATWTSSLPGTYVTSVAVHPSKASIVLAASACIYRSTDGGSTWITILPAGSSSTVQVVFDPANGDIGYAATLQGLYRSTDSGGTWNPVAGRGLPAGPYGSITVAVAPSSTNILYLAVKGTDQHRIGFYRSADSGATWTQTGAPYDDIAYWGWSLRVHPGNPNLIYAGSLYLSMSTDGGKTWTGNDSTLHVDHHVQAYSADGNTLYVGNDGGIWKTSNPTAANTSWTSLNATLNTVMFYPGIAISPSTANSSFAGTQDNSVLDYHGSPSWDFNWSCGDAGFAAMDFYQPQNLYVSCYSPTGVWASINGLGAGFHFSAGGINLQEPSAFLPPLVMDSSNPRRLYYGTNRVYQTLDGAGSWTAISPNFATGHGFFGTTIAVAPSDPSTVYLGGTAGFLFVTRNALSGTSAAWTARNLPVVEFITQITIDPQNPLTAWVATAYTNNSQLVYRTTDGGLTWTSLSAGLPKIAVNDILVDPDIANTIYAATDIGVYRTVDGGQSWLPLATGLPNVICHGLGLHRPSRTLRVATYGRGMWDLSVPVSGPALSIAMTHAGTFAQGQKNATYAITIVNIGQAPTSGTVTVTDQVPAGLTAIAMAGPGWACAQPSGPCTRSDVLPGAGFGYAPITLTVNVAGNAPAVVTNTAVMSGGGGINTSNNTAGDATTVMSAQSGNLALNRSATQSSTFPGYPTAIASSAVDGSQDGNFSDGSVTATNLDTNAWWQLDLSRSATISSVVIWNRTDCCGSRLNDYWVFISDTPFFPTDTPATLQNRPGTFSSHQTAAPNPSTTIAAGGAQGRYVRVQLSGTDYLSLAEVQVIGVDGSLVHTDLAQGQAATQSSTFPGYASAVASAAVDGRVDGNFSDGSVTATNADLNAWWQVDLGASAVLDSVAVWNRTDCCGSRLNDYWVFVSDTPFLPTDTPATLRNRPATFSNHQTAAPNPSTTIVTPAFTFPTPVGILQGRYVRVQLSGTNYLSLAEVQVFGLGGAPPPTNVAQGKAATQSSTFPGYATDGASAAVDGNTDGNFGDGSVTATVLDGNPWWQVDLGASTAVNSIVIWNRTDCCSSRLSDYWVFVSDTPFLPSDAPVTLQNRPGTFSSHQTSAPNPSTTIAAGAQGRYVRVQLHSTIGNYLSLAEVQVFGQ